MNNSISIKQNSILGRYLIANKNITKQEIIIEEIPFAYGPKVNSCCLCLGCYCPLNGELNNNININNRCSECGWPLCEKCDEYGAEDHHNECEIFCKFRVKFYNSEKISLYGCPQLDCITPLRVLLKMEEDPERWEKEVSIMECHEDERKKQEDIWNADLINVARYLRGPCKLLRFSEELIMKVIGILEVNAFEAKTIEGYAIRCLYPITGILAHNCVPNTTRSIYPSENYRIRLRAMVDIKEGQQLYHSYTYTLQGTAARQAHLKAGKFFTCKCERCSDPTELGTHFSSFKCSRCDPGLITTTDPFDDSADWKCLQCDFKTSSNAIKKALSVIQSEVDNIQNMENSPEKLENTEKLLKKYRGVLHPLHFIQTNLRQNLIEMYGRVEGYEMPALPDVVLEHKEDLCRSVLKVLNIFEPGISRSRAFILYELHVPIVLLAKTAYTAGVLAGQALKKKLQEAVDILSECAEILQYEDPSTPEGNLAFIAIQAKEQLKTSIEQI